MQIRLLATPRAMLDTLTSSGNADYATAIIVMQIRLLATPRAMLDTLTSSGNADYATAIIVI